MRRKAIDSMSKAGDQKDKAVLILLYQSSSQGFPCSVQENMDPPCVSSIAIFDVKRGSVVWLPKQRHHHHQGYELESKRQNSA